MTDQPDADPTIITHPHANPGPIPTGPAALVAYINGQPVAAVTLDRRRQSAEFRQRARAALLAYGPQVLAWGAARPVPDVPEVAV